MKFELEIAMDNDAFGETRDDAAAEVERILAGLSVNFAKHVSAGLLTFPIRDANGNRVGEWRVTARRRMPNMCK